VTGPVILDLIENLFQLLGSQAQRQQHHRTISIRMEQQQQKHHQNHHQKHQQLMRYFWGSAESQLIDRSIDRPT
jgi:hypothetical protein